MFRLWNGCWITTLNLEVKDKKKTLPEKTKDALNVEVTE